MVNDSILKKSMRLLPLLVVSIYVFSSCSKENDVYDNPLLEQQGGMKGRKVGDLIINDSTLMLNAASLEQIKSITLESVVFDSEPVQSDSIYVGALLVGVKHDGTSLNNIMGRVSNIDIKNGEWHIDLQPIELREFIYSGTISGRVDPMFIEGATSKGGNSQDAFFIQDIEGFPSYNYLNEEAQKTKALVALPRIQHSKTFNIPSINVPLIDMQSSVDVTAGFTPTIEYTVRFGFWGFEDFSVNILANDILVDLTAHAYGGLKLNVETADMYAIPIFPIFLGPTGLIISPTVSAGPYAIVQSGVSVDAKLLHVEGNISYCLNRPYDMPNFNLHSKLFLTEDLSIKGSLNAEAGLQMVAGMSLTFLATNLSSINGSAKIGAGTSLEKGGSNELKIYGRVNADARLVLGSFPFMYQRSYPLASWNPTFYSRKF